MSKREFDLILYGATGFTGRQADPQQASALVSRAHVLLLMAGPFEL